MALFTVGEVGGHGVGDQRCPACSEEYPEPCRCGGLMHATDSTAEDPDGNVLLVTMCDQCGRSEDQLDEV